MFNAIPGYGVEVEHRGAKILLGNRKLMEANNLDTSTLEGKMSAFEEEGKTAMLLAVDNQLAGLIAVADTLKEHSADAVKTLQQMGLEVIMITGDNQRTANAIAKQVGVNRVFSEVLPSEKATEIKRLQSEGKVVAMVGDGINDAPALAQANIGIAVGSGTDVAIETGDIVLIKNDLRDVVVAIQLSRATMKKIRQNLFLGVLLQHRTHSFGGRRILPNSTCAIQSSVRGSSNGKQLSNRSYQRFTSQEI